MDSSASPSSSELSHSSPERQEFHSHTEPISDELITDTEVETDVAIDEAWYAEERTYLINVIRQLRYQALQADEKCRRQKEENEEIRHEASKQLQQKDQHIAELTKRLNDLHYNPDILNDDEAIQTMAKLSQKLEVWVKGSFKDPQLLQNLPLLELVDVPYGPLPVETISLQTTHQKWGFIRAFVAAYLFYYFFDDYMVGVRNQDIKYSLMTMESEIFNQCPGHVADNWHSATSMAIQSLTEGYLEEAGFKCMTGIEQLASCASSNPGLREKKLRELIQSCVDFKRRLERQPARYKFSQTFSGHKFISRTMQTVTGQEGEGAVVEFCLWPGLWKGDVLLYPETVWSKMDEVSEASEASVEPEPQNRKSQHLPSCWSQ
ncbi:hypothetical protein CNMCM5793_007614 [Aspergillus hiratsukae]|uniref:Uncharacterized protein n=1 Tax=Aspergillus hiratsukae TaxID=1194566 RepID=A0A8H6UQD8_9EURO|nr:hypothetical protein CNMCM5793_007614 [Aspergillus hiratsukae]KAF7160364.1 hypothetical protein CNMCM6106_007805 [Aspergillus hiratsukae]